MFLENFGRLLVQSYISYSFPWSPLITVQEFKNPRLSIFVLPKSET